MTDTPTGALRPFRNEDHWALLGVQHSNSGANELGIKAFSAGWLDPTQLFFLIISVVVFDQVQAEERKTIKETMIKDNHNITDDLLP